MSLMRSIHFSAELDSRTVDDEHRDLPPTMTATQAETAPASAALPGRAGRDS
jgi:hypothetical protein